MLVVIQLFDYLNEEVSLLEVLLFCEVLSADCELVDPFAVVQIEPKFNVIFVAEKITFDFAKGVDLVSGQFRKQLLFQRVVLVGLSNFFLIPHQKMRDELWLEVIQYTAIVQKVSFFIVWQIHQGSLG